MNEIVVRNGSPTEHELMVFQTMAKSAVESKMYKGIGDQAGVMMIMLAARELGIPPMQALNGGLNIISGKVEISARMMSALIRKANHHIYVKENTDTICTLTGRRCDTGETLTTSFSIADAQKAGLVKQGGGWTKFPKDMCFARALSRLARQLFSDVIGIGYVEGEIKATEAEIAIPDDVELIDKISFEDSEAKTRKLFGQFPEEDDILLTEYMNVVMKHFGWTLSQCVDKFLEEKDLISKFNKWKNKKNLTEKIDDKNFNNDSLHVDD